MANDQTKPSVLSDKGEFGKQGSESGSGKENAEASEELKHMGEKTKGAPSSSSASSPSKS